MLYLVSYIQNGKPSVPEVCENSVDVVEYVEKHIAHGEVVTIVGTSYVNNSEASTERSEVSA